MQLIHIMQYASFISVKLFDLTPIQFISTQYQDGHPFTFERTDINALLIVTLALSLVITLLWMVLSKFSVGRCYGLTLVALYALFLLLSLLDLLDVIKFQFSAIIGN